MFHVFKQVKTELTYIIIWSGIETEVSTYINLLFNVSI